MKWDVILMLCAYSFTSRDIKAKNRASSRLLAQNRVSQMFWEPIKNRATPRSALLKAVLSKLACVDAEVSLLVTLPKSLILNGI